MWFTCCITSLLLEPSTSFHISCDPILSSKNRKMKINQKGNENENKKIRKAKSTFCDLDMNISFFCQFISKLYYFSQVNPRTRFCFLILEITSNIYLVCLVMEDYIYYFEYMISEAKTVDLFFLHSSFSHKVFLFFIQTFSILFLSFLFSSYSKNRRNKVL